MLDQPKPLGVALRLSLRCVVFDGEERETRQEKRARAGGRDEYAEHAPVAEEHALRGAQPDALVGGDERLHLAAISRVPDRDLPTATALFTLA